MDPSILIRDPSTANSRIYIGNLADNCRKELEEHFSKFGIINGMVLNRGFGFVQFEKEENAIEAIQAENGNVFLGRKLIVRNALQNSGNEKRNISSGGREAVREGGSNWRNNNRNSGGRGDSGRDRSPINDNDRGDSSDWNYYGRNSVSFDSNDYSNRTAGSFVPDVYVKPAEHNDCEIIVVSKTLTEYAESIESHLKRMGLSVDLLFPNDDVPIGKVLANISSRGSLYAILVTPQNEEHRSITVNILYGTPAEHRNMPVEDAINFIVANFQEKLKQDKIIASSSSSVAGQITPTLIAPPLTDRHPDTVQTLINLLANNRTLTVLQYDRIIKYLQERRELQVKFELGEPTPIIPTITNQELELQQKILSILNKPSITATIQPEVIPIVPTNVQTTMGNLSSSAPPSNSSSNVLFDPVVQKALDSILQTNFYFKR